MRASRSRGLLKFDHGRSESMAEAGGRETGKTFHIRLENKISIWK